MAQHISCRQHYAAVLAASQLSNWCTVIKGAHTHVEHLEQLLKHALSGQARLKEVLGAGHSIVKRCCCCCAATGANLPLSHDHRTPLLLLLLLAPLWHRLLRCLPLSCCTATCGACHASCARRSSSTPCCAWHEAKGLLVVVLHRACLLLLPGGGAPGRAWRAEPVIIHLNTLVLLVLLRSASTVSCRWSTRQSANSCRRSTGQSANSGRRSNGQSATSGSRSTGQSTTSGSSSSTGGSSAEVCRSICRVGASRNLAQGTGTHVQKDSRVRS